MDADVEIIINKDKTQISEALNRIQEKWAKLFVFPFLNDQRENLWQSLQYLLSDSQYEQHLTQILSVIRILSRDKDGLDELASNGILDEIVKLAALITEEKYSNEKSKQMVIVEALKCLSNLVYNSPVAAAICCKNGTIEGIIERSKMINIIYEIKFFDVRLLFILSGMCKETRPRIYHDLNGFDNFTGNLDKAVTEIKDKKKILKLTTEDVKYFCEILKVLFNISLGTDEDKDKQDVFKKLVNLLRELITGSFVNEKDAFELHKQIVYLLTNVQEPTLKYFIEKQSKVETLPKNCTYEDFNLTSVHKILELLNASLGGTPNEDIQNSELVPILTTLLRLATSDRIMRKYLRREILPPLKDVHHRPEDGKTLRNRLCKTLTSPNTQLKNVSAELLFVLCKENVERMIKYTGYGNAAGLFSTYGLLRGRNEKGDRGYSSESEDSDTEEYLQHLHGINPVVGCYEPPKPDPCSNMTEEQKEFEAMKLVNLMDKLTKSGMVKPCLIGEDGRAAPIENVFQLQDNLKNQQIQRNHQDDEH